MVSINQKLTFTIDIYNILHIHIYNYPNLCVPKEYPIMISAVNVILIKIISLKNNPFVKKNIVQFALNTQQRCVHLLLC